MSDFDKLAEEAESLLKAMSAQEADSDESGDGAESADAGEGAQGADEGAAATGVDADADAGDEAGMAKSMLVTMPDGTEREAFDGEALVKSLIGQNKALHSANAVLVSNQDKTMTLIKSLVATVGELKKSINALGDQGRGRKAVVAVAGADASAASTADKGLDRDVFMTKCMTLQAQGKLTGLDISMVEASFNNRMPPPDRIAKVVNAA